MSENIKKVTLTPAACSVDLGDGSERGLYVDQDYILQKLGRPHRGISLMYCYYPNDPAWPKRASEAYADKEVSFAWDYPYDDYFPYAGGLTPNPEGTTFDYMDDIRRHGQDVVLTITVDPRVTDDHIIAIAKDLRPYGRVLLRMNHECTGNWFAYTKWCTYQEIADFYVRFTNIVKEHAPNVKMVFCGGCWKKDTDPKIEMEDEFTEAVRATHIWSIDNYLALNWGWPFEIADFDNNGHGRGNVKDIFEGFKKSKDRFRFICGGEDKQLVLSELNADGDVTGPYDQALMMREIAELIKADKDKTINAFTLYQFRDDGRLGLEITDPNNSNVGIETPLLNEYRNIIHEDFFKPGMEYSDDINLPAKLRFGGSEDSDGIAMEVTFEADPVFAEAYFEDELESANLMLEINGRWFYKAPGVKCIDLMPAFFNKRLSGETKLYLNIFAPPATGRNDETQGSDWMENYYYTLEKLPRLRLRYRPIA